MPNTHTVPRPNHSPRILALAVLAAAVGCTDAASRGGPLAPRGASLDAAPVARQVIAYDATDPTGYAQKWANIYGPLELALGGTRTVDTKGVRVEAVPFHATADFSVYDHLKYIAVSTQAFAVPKNGSLAFAVDITAATPGTVKDKVMHGCYGAPYSFASLAQACASPWSAPVLQGQQAGVVLNMINFATGQLFDWFVSDDEVFALIERLPSNVTNPALPPSDAAYVGLDKAYTQIIKTQSIASGGTHRVAIRFTRGPHTSRVEYFLDGAPFASVDNVGVPLDVQGVPFTGVYPSYGQGEPLADKLDSFVIGHGLFSLLDAFPFQHPERFDLSVSIPEKERAFGQGAIGIWKNFTVTVTPGQGQPFTP